MAATANSKEGIIVGSRAKIAGLKHPRNQWLNGRIGLVDEVQDDGYVVFTLKELHPHRGSLPEEEPQRIRLHSANLELLDPQTESTASTAAGEADIHKGCKAMIVGLLLHGEYNGAQCTVEKWHMDSERWVVRLHGVPDKHVLVRERNLQIVGSHKDYTPEDGKPAKPQFWNEPVADAADPRSLIGRYVKRTFSGTAIYGRILRWYGPRLGFFIRYEDGESEHCSVTAVRRIIVRNQASDLSPQDRRLADRKIAEYPSSPSSSSSDGDESTATRKRKLKSPPVTRPKVLRKLTTTERVPRAGQWVDRDDLPARSVYDLVSDGPIDIPLLLYNPLFIKHNGGAQDKHGRWVRSIKRVLQTRKRYIVPDCKTSLWDSCAWADSVSNAVTISDVLVTNIHSKRYLADLVSIDNYLQQQVELKDKPLEEIPDSELPVVDLCSKRCARLIGRALTLWPGECCMDPYTLKAALLRCGMMRDALVAVLSGSAPTAFVLARPACHHVPYRVKSEDIHPEDDMPELNALEASAVKFMNSPKNKGARTADGILIDTTCEEFQEHGDKDYMLNCDREGCNKSWHVYCLPDPLPKSILKKPEFASRNWYCPACLDTPGLIKPQEADEMRAFVASFAEHSGDESVLPGMNLASSELDDDALDSDGGMSEMSENAPLMGSSMNIQPGDELSLGFCFINAVAYAIKVAQAAAIHEGRKIKFAILDVDVHHGNGNETAFYRDADVLHMSIHRWGKSRDGGIIMPGTGAHTDLGRQASGARGMNLNFEMREGDGDREYTDVVTQITRPVLEQWKPDVLLLLCGFDALDHSQSQYKYQGPGMDCRLSPEWFGWLYPYVASCLDHGKVLCCAEGGYDPKMTGPAGGHLVRSILDYTEATRDGNEAEKIRHEALESLPNCLRSITDWGRQKAWLEHLHTRKVAFHDAGWNGIDTKENLPPRAASAPKSSAG